MKRIGGLTASCNGIKPSFLVGVSAFFVLVLALAIPIAAALPAPTVTFIPDRFSENGSFAALVNPGIFDRPVRVTWVSPGISETDLGLFPRSGDKWVCYFSNIDKDATCGPTPFTSIYASYDMIIKSVDNEGGMGNRTIDVVVGSIALTPEITVQGSKVIIVIYTSESADNVSYAIYDSDFVRVQDYTYLEKTPYGHFDGETNIEDSGIYYIALKAERGATSSFGGELKKIQMGGTDGGYVSGDIEADSISLELLMNKSQIYRNINNQMRNIGNDNLTGLSVSVDPRLASQISVLLEKSTLRSGESMYFTVEIKNVQNAMNLTTKANITTANGDVVGQIPLRLDVSVLNECTDTGQCPACPTTGTGIIIAPTSWSDEFIIGQSAEMNFTISNTGDTELTSISSTKGALGTVASVSLPNSIPAGSSRQMGISLSPYSGGVYSGIVTVTTSTGSQSILVSTVFYDDISYDIEDATSALQNIEDGLSFDQLDKLSDVVDGIKTSLIDAETYFDSGSYESAAQEYESANAKIAVLEDVVYALLQSNGALNGAGGDNTLIIILVVVLVVLGVALIYLKKFRGAGGGEDEEFEEEIEDEEGY